MANDSWEKWDELSLETYWRLDRLKELSARTEKEYSLIPARQRRKGGLIKKLKLAALYIASLFSGRN
ncbi:MAG: hypothetical protein K5663_07355 [Clostridiales bacterium]|nr:hypothetical protein [Clostridiales bacterium]